VITRDRCVKQVVRRIHPFTSFLRPTIPRGDAFYGDGRLLEACRHICDGTDKGWACVIEARVEGRPRKSRGRAIANIFVPSSILKESRHRRNQDLEYWLVHWEKKSWIKKIFLTQLYAAITESGKYLLIQNDMYFGKLICLT